MRGRGEDIIRSYPVVPVGPISDPKNKEFYYNCLIKLSNEHHHSILTKELNVAIAKHYMYLLKSQNPLTGNLSK